MHPHGAGDDLGAVAPECGQDLEKVPGAVGSEMEGLSVILLPGDSGVTDDLDDVDAADAVLPSRAVDLDVPEIESRNSILMLRNDGREVRPTRRLERGATIVRSRTRPRDKPSRARTAFPLGALTPTPLDGDERAIDDPRAYGMGCDL